MKTTLLLLFALAISGFSHAQGKANIIVFADGGEQFYLLVNGATQNGSPESNVKVNGIDEGNYSIKIMFTDPGLNHITKNAMIEPGHQYTFKVTTNRKGSKVLRFFGDVAIDEGTSSGASEYDYSKVSRTEESTAITSTISSGTETEPNNGLVTQSTTVTSTTTTSGNPNGESESISVDMNVGGFNMDVNVNIDEGSNGSVNTSSSTTTTTTTTSGYEGSSDISVTESSTTSSACAYPNADMASINKALDAESFEDDKLALAKRIVSKKCLTAENVKTICEKFDFEDNRLVFAKFAYDHTNDKDNYYVVDEVFDFSDSKEELSKYIMSR